MKEAPTTKLVVAGHSVGAYMAIHAASELPQDSILRLFLLFPTVRNIGATANGRRLIPFFRHFRGAAWLFTHAIASLPHAWQLGILRPFMPGADAGAFAAALSIVHPEVAYNALWLALHEMNEIQELDTVKAAKLEEKMVFYFAETDDWVNPEDPFHIRERYPKARIINCADGHRHAFVLSPESSRAMADHATVWLAEATKPPVK